MGLTLCMMGVITYINNDIVMVCIGTLLRFMQGIFKSLILIPATSFLIILNYDKKIEYVGYFQSILGVGNSIGPVVGSTLYSFVGYLYMFVIVGGLFLILLLLIKLTMITQINEEDGNITGLVKSNSSDTEPHIQDVSI